MCEAHHLMSVGVRWSHGSAAANKHGTAVSRIAQQTFQPPGGVQPLQVRETTMMKQLWLLTTNLVEAGLGYLGHGCAWWAARWWWW